MGIWYDKQAYELLKKCSDKKDITEWNEYRKATDYGSVNLRFTNIKSFYLQNADLQNVDLRGSNLENADFNLADVDRMLFLPSIYLWILIGTFFLISLLVFLIFTTSFPFFPFVISTLSSLVIPLFLWKKYGPFDFLFKSLNELIVEVPILLSITAVFVTVVGNRLDFIDNNIKAFLGVSYPNFSYDSKIFLLYVFFSLFMVFFFISFVDKLEKSNQLSISSARNPENAIGFNSNFINNKTKSLAKELRKEASELNKAIEITHDDYEKQKLVIRLEKLEEKIQFYNIQEEKAGLQKTQIENVISELQSPYKYIHQTISKIEWHNRFYYGSIVVLIGIFIYAIAHGYIDQKMATFSSLFTKETLPSFGTIFGVILFYGSPVLIGISLIIYFITEINKNIDKVTELQEQERNIKQIASTIKAKAQVGMSDEEFVKETKNLIQKYQEGMMAGMFTKEKTVDKEEKYSPTTYREKMIANGISKLLMQALKK